MKAQGQVALRTSRDMNGNANGTLMQMQINFYGSYREKLYDYMYVSINPVNFTLDLTKMSYSDTIWCQEIDRGSRVVHPEKPASEHTCAKKQGLLACFKSKVDCRLSECQKEASHVQDGRNLQATLT